MDKTPKGIRIVEIILGVIAIALAGYVISNPEELASEQAFSLLLGEYLQ